MATLQTGLSRELERALSFAMMHFIGYLCPHDAALLTCLPAKWSGMEMF